MIQAERLVGDALGGRLKPDRTRLVGGSVADDPRHLVGGERPVGLDREHTDVEFAGECAVGLGDGRPRRGDVGGVGFVEPVVGLDDAAFDVDRPTVGIPFRLDRHERRLLPEPFDREERRIE